MTLISDRLMRYAASLLGASALIALTACSFGDAITTANSDELPAASARSDENADGALASTSVYGAYLAGRLAQVEGDPRAASRFYNQALAYDLAEGGGEGTSILLSRAFTAALSAGDIATALGIASRLDDMGAVGGLARIVLALDAVRTDNLEEAEDHLQEVTPSGFLTLVQPLMQAWVKLGQGDADGGLEALDALNRQKAFRPFYDYHAALIAEAGGKLDAAEKHYGEALAGRAGKAVRLTEAYGAFLERAGKVDEARQLYVDYLEEYPSSPTVRAALANVGSADIRPVMTARFGIAEGLYGAATALAQERAAESANAYAHLALFLEPDFPIAQTLLADMAENDERWQDAIDIYRSIDQDSPYAYNARIRIAWVLNRMDRTEEAIGMLKTLVAENREDLEAPTTLADVLRDNKRFREAAIAYGTAIQRIDEVKKSHWTLYYARGISYEQSKQWEKAEPDFLEALSLNPDQPQVLNYLAYSWVDQGRHLDRAMNMLERAVEIRPNDGYIVDSFGWAFYRLGNYEEAVEHLEKAVSLMPADPTINDHLGDAYWQVGRHNEARFQWERALGLDPQDSLIPVIQRKLEVGLEVTGSSSSSLGLTVQ